MTAGSPRVTWDPGSKPRLPLTTAWRIAWREMRVSKAKFAFVLLSVAVGVAALTGVRGFSQAFQQALLGDARGLMAGDLSARLYRQITPAEARQLDAIPGVERTVETQTVTMASLSANAAPLLVSLKAVDPAKYPFYGKVVLAPAGNLRDVLTNSTVVVDQNLLVRLNAKVGDVLKIGNNSFRIAAMLVSEPDRMTAGIGFGPRVMMTRRGMIAAGLLGLGSRATERYLFKLENPKQIADVRARIEKILPDALVTDFRQTNPQLTSGLDHATGLLSLICLVAMALGAVGVGMAMRAHLQQRLESLAIMKSMGATSGDLLRIYMLQTVFLGALGGVLGILIGLGVQMAFPAMLGTLLPVHPALSVAARPMAAALGVGILTTILFCLPPLLDVRHVRPIAALRHVVESSEARGWLTRQRERKLQWAAIVLILAGLAGIATGLSDSWLIGRWFAASLAITLAVVLTLAAVLLSGLRAFLERTRLRLPSAVRHGLANLYRPGNQSAAVLSALGAGVMLILAIYLMQGAIVRQMHNEVAPDTPNVFLVDMSPNQVAGVRSLIAAQPGVRSSFVAFPVITAHLVSIGGVSVEKLHIQHIPKRLVREANLTWTPTMPKGTKILQGHWWKPDDATGLAVPQRIARRLHLHIGSQMVFQVSDHTVSTPVSVIYKPDSNRAFSRSEFAFAPKEIQEIPATWYGAVHFDPGKIAPMERALFAAYPTVTVVSLADILNTIASVARRITLVIRFLAAFSILAGIIILASSIAGTRFRRVREVVVLKTLGATRARIAQVFSIEFAVLGVLAGVVGAVFANLLTAALLHHMKVAYPIDWAATIAAVIATAALAVITGWAASFRTLGQKPLEVLREE